MATFNAEQIDALADQIRNTVNCESLLFIIDNHLNAMLDVVESMIAERVKILTDLLPIMQLPGPNPAAIVKWIKKFVTGLVGPQLRAAINLARQLIAAKRALLNLRRAISESAENISRCIIDGNVISNIARLDDRLDRIEGIVNQSISNSFSEINQTLQQLSTITEDTSLIDLIDTSSESAFEQSIEQNEQLLNNTLSQFIAAEDDEQE